MKNLKNINLRVLVYLLASGITLASPMVVRAEEGDILYIQEEDEHEEVDITEETINDMINAELEKDESQGEKNQESKDEELDNEANLGEENGIGEASGTEEGSESTEEDKKEYGKDEFIDDDNWSQDQDIVENAGSEIPDTVQTEAERKGKKPILPPEEPEPNPEPTPEEPEPKEEPSQSVQQQIIQTPLIQEPNPAPKTGYGDYEIKKAFELGVALFVLHVAIGKINKLRRDAKEQSSNSQDDLEEKTVKVVDSRKKKKSNKAKILKRN